MDTWKDLNMFLMNQKSPKAKQFLEFLRNKEKMEIAAFLSDITYHLDDLNLKLQGKNNTVCNLMSAFRAFRKKLEIGDIQEEGLLHYPKLKSLASGTQHHSYVEFLDKLIEIF